MKKIFNSLEALEALKQDDIVLEEGDIQQLSFLMQELDQEVTGSFEQIENLFDKIDEASATIERLENIAVVVAEHGICRATMEAVDPFNELVKAGLVTAYEELADTPVKDQHAEAAVEGITDAIKGFFDKIGNFFGKIVSAFKDLGVAWKKNSTYYDVEFGSIRKRLKTIKEFDEEKFGKKQVRAYEKDDFQKVVILLEQMIGIVKDTIVVKTLHDIDGTVAGKSFDKETIDKMNEKISSYFKPLSNPAYKDVFGFYTTIDDNGKVSFATGVDRKIVDNREELGKLGWKPSDAEPVATKCFNLLSGLVMTGSLLTSTEKSATNIHKLLFNSRNMFDKLDSEEKAGFKYLVSSTNKTFNLIMTLFKLTFSAQRDVFYTGSIVGKTAIKCGK